MPRKPTKSRVQRLMADISRALDRQGRGSRSRMAEALGVGRQVVNDWLMERRMPDGEHTLALQEWLEKAEKKRRRELVAKKKKREAKGKAPQVATEIN